VDRYIYLIGGSALCLGTAVMLRFRRDLIRIALIYGVIGAAMLVLTELLFTRDYWHPPTLLGSRTLSVEDVLFGFGITTIPLLCYPAIFRQRYGPSECVGHIKLYLLFVALSAAGLPIGVLALHVNSILLACALLALFTVTVCLARPDLRVPAIFAIAFMTTVSVGAYVILFDIMAPGWWDRYWLLTHTVLGVTVLGNVPLTEILVYVTWSGFAATQHPFICGSRFVPLA
jgi:hypothetical protein